PFAGYMGVTLEAGGLCTPSYGRRDFLARTAALGGVLLAPAGLRPDESDPPAPDYRTWAGVRAAFPLRHDALHFTAFLLSPHPSPVAAAIESYRRAIDPDPDGYLFQHEAEREQRVLHAASHYLGAPADEIALTDSTTMGLGLLYGGLKLAPGDELLTSTH